MLESRRDAIAGFVYIWALKPVWPVAQSSTLLRVEIRLHTRTLFGVTFSVQCFLWVNCSSWVGGLRQCVVTVTCEVGNAVRR